MSKHVEAAVGHHADQILVPAEVRGQALHQYAAVALVLGLGIRRVLLQKPHRLSEMIGALVCELVSVHRSQYDIIKTPRQNGFRNILRLFWI